MIKSLIITNCKSLSKTQNETVKTLLAKKINKSTIIFSVPLVMSTHKERADTLT